MFDIENQSRSITLGHVAKYDVIEYGNENLEESIYVVFNTNRDDKIPAILLELWKFKGGYDHAFANVMEIEFNVNKRVKYFIPSKIEVKIQEIVSYRPKNSGLTEKEMFFFDVMPDKTSATQNVEFDTPFQCAVKINDELCNVILPSWTPIQKLPLEKITQGSTIEIWTVESAPTVMKVVKL